MEVVSVIILTIAMFICLVAFFAVLEVFFSRRLDSTRSAIQGTPGRAFLVGLINLAFFAVIALAFVALGNWIGAEFLSVIGLLILIPPTIGIVFGLGGAVIAVGELLFPEYAAFKRKSFGTLALAFTCALPFVG